MSDEKDRSISRSQAFIRQPFFVLLFCVVCVGINLGGNILINHLHIPLFLDSVGTILAAGFGGYMPGIAVGYLTNIINGVIDPTNAYYSLLNALIAISAAYLAERGAFRSWKGSVLAAVVFALIGGALGSILTWLIYGFGIGEGISAPFSRALFESGKMSLFWAQFTSDMIIDLADKFVSVIIVRLLIRLIPDSWRNRFHIHGWKQSPLSDQERAEAQKSYSRSMSLRSKILLLISAATIFIAFVTAGISFFLYHRATIDDHKAMAESVADLAEAMIEPDRVEDYLTHGEDAAGYLQVKKELESLRQSSPQIEFIYVYQIAKDGCHVVFDLDTDEYPGAEAGTVVPFDDSFEEYLPSLLLGEEIEPIVTDDTYGWLLTVYRPVRDESGQTVCYACVDISMERITLSEISFLTKVVSLFFGFFILILAIGLWLAEYNLILPINTMALAAGDFEYKSEEDRVESVERFHELNIRTGDEIEHLYNAFTKTNEDTVRYIGDVQRQAEVIARMQNGLILVLADMVESRDQCTGDHVRKTAAYTRVIMNRLREKGLFADILTDEYIESVVNSAPLHDVGKIQVSDTLLNKPGKLTEEEFEQMKTHTTAGGEIIDQAITLVSETGYLHEAKNLALYHHEKWNGKGYPMGLSGEEIPLSARIMAVADVFDALVSRRSYKEPFPFEKAMEIIRESAGSHFDPRVAEAFLDEEDEVRRIAEMNMEKEKAELYFT